MIPKEFIVPIPFASLVQAPSPLNPTQAAECCPPSSPRLAEAPRGNWSTKILTAISGELRFVCWAGTESQENLCQLAPPLGRWGSREPGRQIQARETEARATPADWSEAQPIREKGRCRTWPSRSPRRYGATANQRPAPVRRRPILNLRGERRAPPALLDQIPEDLNTSISSTVKFRGGAGLAHAQWKNPAGRMRWQRKPEVLASVVHSRRLEANQTLWLNAQKEGKFRFLPVSFLRIILASQHKRF